MIRIIGIVLVGAVCAFIELPSLRGRKKELWVFSLLLALGVALGIASALHVPLPNPLDWIAAVFRPFARGTG